MTKFACLKEFLIPDIRKSIDSLPFTTEGYTRAKSILSGKFGKPVIVANAHIKCITSLQIRFQSNSKDLKLPIPFLYRFRFQGSNPNAIHDFHDKLSFSVQAVDTIKKVGKMNGYVRITLEKLSEYMADIV